MKSPFRIYSSIVILALLMGGCSNIKELTVTGTSTQAESTEDSYIKGNSSPLELNNLAQADLPILDSAVENAEVIITGEEHGVSIDTKLRLEFLKHFNEKANFSYCFGEEPYSAAVLVNQYLKSGNEEIIKRLVESYKGSFSYSKDLFEFYKELYKYNKFLPDNKKITFIGIDVENVLSDAIWCLNELVSGKNAPSEIQPIIIELKALSPEKKYSSDQMLKFCSELKESINKNRDLYSKFLGDNLFDFELVNQNIINKVEGGSFEERENRVYDNFKKVYNHLPKGKYFGQFGLSHIPQRKTNDNVGEWLGAKLNYSDSPVKGKVISIAYLYDKSYQRLSDNTVRSASNYIKNDFIDAVAKTDLTLIRLNGKSSLFQTKLIWSIADINATDGATADYYQFYLLVRNAEAVTRYPEANIDK